MEGILWGKGWERSWELKQGPRALEEETPRNPLEREADRSRWREGRELPLCLRPCSLALYTVHPYPRGAGRKGRHQAQRATHQWHRGQVDTEHIENAGYKALNNTKQNKKKKNKEKKSGLVIVPTPGLGHTLEGGRKGGRQEDRVVQDLCSSEWQVALPPDPSREKRWQTVWGLESH